MHPRAGSNRKATGKLIADSRADPIPRRPYSAPYSAEFIPPERVYQGGENASSVIYSLGMLMFYMLSGGQYINAESAVGTVKRHVGLARLAVSAALLPGISAPTIEAVNTMMRQDPAERYQTFEEVEAVLARPGSPKKKGR